MAFWPMWRAEMIVLAVCALLDSALTRWQFGRWELKPIPVPWPHALAIAAFFSIFCLFFPVYVREDGIRAPDDHGSYLDVSWHEIDSIRYFDFLGIKALRLRLIGQKDVVWIPLYLVNMRAFSDLIAQHAGEDHALTHRLARYRSAPDTFV